MRDGGEAKEYSGDTHKTVELSDVGVDVDLDDGHEREPEFTRAAPTTSSTRSPYATRRSATTRCRSRPTDEAGNVSKSAGTAIADTIESEFTVKAAVPTELS